MSDDLARDLRPAITRLYLALRRRAPIAGLSAAQASALSTLLVHAPLRMGALADREGIRMPTATTLVDGLINLGLVHRRPDAVGLVREGRDEQDRRWDERLA